jgi:hypothetical protein
MEQVAVTEIETNALAHDLGTFEGFSFRHQTAIFPNQNAESVVSWNHDLKGEAEFWPSGDHEGVALVFSGRNSVAGAELIHLDHLLSELGNDSVETYVRLHYLTSFQGESLGDLTAETVDDLCCHIFASTSFLDLRKEAALELFEVYYPEDYAVWEKSRCDGLIFDHDLFLDAPVFHTVEITMGDYRLLMVCPN